MEDLYHQQRHEEAKHVGGQLFPEDGERHADGGDGVRQAVLEELGGEGVWRGERG